MGKSEDKEKSRIEETEDMTEEPVSAAPESGDDTANELETYKALVCSLRDERDAFETEMEKSRKEADRLKTAAFDLKTQLERMQTDFANYKRRTAEQASAVRGEAEAELISRFIPVLDVIDKALKMITDEASAEGVRMIGQQIDDIFAAVGVEEIPALGEEFDPTRHNAVLREQTDDDEQDGRVTEVFQKGYHIGDRILRHSVVKVAGK